RPFSGYAHRGAPTAGPSTVRDRTGRSPDLRRTTLPRRPHLRRTVHRSAGDRRVAADARGRNRRAAADTRGPAAPRRDPPAAADHAAAAVDGCGATAPPARAGRGAGPA